MLEIKVMLSPEGWDEEKQEFVEPKIQTLKLEHSLVSLSKWESKWRKPFLTDKEKTPEESLDYIKFMTLTQNVDPDVYNYISQENMNEIRDYIGAELTATTFSQDKNSKGRLNGEQITSELVYYWMVALQIPFECQKWHLSRLITLVKVCNIKNQPPKKMSRSELASRNRSLNAARRQRLNSKG
jgi:hypothetical protein